MSAHAPNDALRDFPDLRTPRLLLRHLRMEDIHDIFAYASDPEMTPFVYWEPHRSPNDTREFLERTLLGYADGAPPAWGIEHLADRIIIGSCAFHEMAMQHARGEIGYALARKYWGQGLMTEAVRAMLAYGFSVLRLNRIEARCDVDNIASWRVMEKAGMKFEGVLRQNIFLHSRPRDARIYSILCEELLPWCRPEKSPG